MRVHVFELRYPGRSLRDQSGSHIRAFLDELDNSLAKAGVSLALYETVKAVPSTEPSWVRQRTVVMAIAQELESRLPADPDEQQRILQQIPPPDLVARRQEWAQGIMPDDYKRQLPFVYAHEVLYALDTIGCLIKVLAEITERAEVIAAEKDFKAWLPNVRDIRNSAHHMEDRIRGLQTGGKPIDLQAVNNESFNAPQGTLSLNNIFNDKLGYTAGDGNYYQIEISVATVTKAQKAIQRAIDGLEWGDNYVRVAPGA